MLNRIVERAYCRLSGLLYNRSLIPYAMASLIHCKDEKPSEFIIEVALNSAQIAIKERILNIRTDRPDSHLVNKFPGEHYRLLNAITKVMSPSLIVEIGTYTGLGVCSMLQSAGTGKIVTYDIISWNEFQTHLSDAIIKTGAVSQIIADLSIKENFNYNMEILNSAEIIFLDGPKNSSFERHFLNYLTILKPARRRLLIIDDIRFINMINIWASILSPKIDLTSFGHWTGTGLVDISNGLRTADSL